MNVNMREAEPVGKLAIYQFWKYFKHALIVLDILDLSLINRNKELAQKPSFERHLMKCFL